MKRSTILATVLVAGGAGEAAASGFVVARFGGEHGHPVTDNPTAIYYNPAGLSFGKGTRLYIDGTFAWRTVNYTRSPDAIENLGAGTPDTPEGIAANSGEASLFNLAAVPFVGAVTDFGIDNLGVGVALYVPIGGTSVWDDNDDVDPVQFAGAVDGVQRWWGTSGTIRSMYGTLAGSWHFPSLRLRVGLGANLVVTEVDTIRARNVDGTDDLIVGATKQPKEGRTLIEAKGYHGSVGAGLIWEPVDQWWIGLSYQSVPGFGEQRLEGTLVNYFPNRATDPDPAKRGTTEDDIDFLQTLPDIVRLGVRGRPTENTEVRLFGDFTRWSVFEKQCVVNRGKDCGTIAKGASAPGSSIVLNIPRKWENAFGVRAGGSYWLNPDVELFAGAGFDSSAVPDETLDPVLLDQNKVTASLGGRVQLLDRSLALAGTYTQVIYLTRELDPGANDFVPPSKSPDAAGEYKQAVGALNINVEYAF